MRIVEVINGLSNRGGAEVFLIGLCKHLKQMRGTELLLISLNGNIDMFFVEEIKALGIPFISLDRKRKLDFDAIKHFRKSINSFAPDVIHFHLSCLKTYFLAFGLKKHKWKIVQTIHSIPGSNIGRTENLLRRFYISKKSLIFVGITKSLTNQALQMYKGAECFTIFNGVEISTEPKPNFSARKLYDFVIVASMTETKNHQMLFDAMRILKQTFPGVRLACVGDGPLFTENREYSLSRDLGDNVSFLGKQYDVYETLAISKCFVLASKREGNPISILEAMNASLPIIAPRIGGISDVVENGKNGLLFEANNVGSLVVCLHEAVCNENKMKRIGHYNHEYVKRFSMEKCALEYYNLFAKLIHEK